MHKWYFIAIVISVVLYPSLSYSKELYRLPQGIRLDTERGMFQAYTLEEFKILLKMDVDLEYFEKDNVLYKKMFDEATRITEDQVKIVTSQDKQINILKNENSRLIEKWKEDNRLRHECENRPMFGNWIAWTLAGVAAVVALSFGIVLAVNISK